MCSLNDLRLYAIPPRTTFIKIQEGYSDVTKQAVNSHACFFSLFLRKWFIIGYWATKETFCKFNFRKFVLKAPKVYVVQ